MKTTFALTALAIAAALTLAACASSSSSPTAPPPVSSSPSIAAAPAAARSSLPVARPRRSPRPKRQADPATACVNRAAASGDIYVRMVVPGVPTQAQELGGGWIWNVTLHKCLTSVQMMIATAPQVAGNCTQVGYVVDNPGYDPNATPARPLKNVVAQTGPAC